MVGQTLGHYKILELLGKGGMGEVYWARDEVLGREVALKTLPPTYTSDPERLARLTREAKALASLNDPHIAGIYGLEQDGNQRFMVLELVNGVSLSDPTVNRLDHSSKLDIAVQIAEVLETVHTHGIVHRDLKPNNILVTPDNKVKVLDFGLARHVDLSQPSRTSSELPAEPRGIHSESDEVTLTLSTGPADETEFYPEQERLDREIVQTRLGQVVGTPVFMSPEQASGEVASTASDMYSFGLLLQVLFTGSPPYPRDFETPEILAWAREGRTLPADGIDRDLSELITRLKARAAAARPTASTTVERLRWIRGKPKRRFRRFAVGAAIALTLGAAGKYTLELRSAREDAELRRQQAEELIGFMIGDLRDKLAPVNRLEVLDDIGNRARDYFAAIPPSELSGRELLLRTRTLSQIGQVRTNQGDLESALEVFQEAERLAERIVKLSPENTEWRAELGIAHFWVGSVYWHQQDFESALGRFRKYLDEATALVEGDPENPAWRLELAYAYSNIGSVQEAQGETAQAAQAFRKSLDITNELSAADPENSDLLRELAASHSWLGESYYSQGDLDTALEMYQKNLHILTKLAQLEPANRQHQWLLGIAHGKVGLVFLRKGALDEAARECDSYVSINRALVNQDPDNQSWRRELAVALRQCGDLATQACDLEEASSYLSDSVQILSDLVVVDPRNTDWLDELEISKARLQSIQDAASACN